MKYPDFWHKEILCSNQMAIQKELVNFLTPHITELENNNYEFEHVKNMPGFVLSTPSLTAWLKELGCSRYRDVALVVIGANKNQKIHADAQKNDLALNIGLQIENTTTRMYKIRDGEPTIVTYGRQKLTYNDYNSCVLEQHTEYSLSNNPVLFNTKHVHQVINPTDKTRIAISIRFIEDPTHLIYTS